MFDVVGKVRIIFAAVFIFILGALNAVYGQDSTVWVWYGTHGDTAINANINDTLYVDVYVQTSSDAYVENIHLPMGFNDLYIDASISSSAGSVYYPLTEWAVANFNPPEGSPPNSSGWSSQTFVGFARWIDPNAPLFHVEIPWKVLTMAVITVNNSGLLGHTYAAIGPGRSSSQGPANAGDSTGAITYEVIEYFSPVHFVQPGGYIKGTVVDTLGIPIEGVIVSDLEGINARTTDSLGYYIFSLPQGTYSIIFSHEGYYDTTVNNITVTVGDTTDLDMAMTPGTNYPDGTPNIIDVHQNYPNPFNQGTIIEFELDRPAFVTVEIFDILGRKVATVGSFLGQAGLNHVKWNSNGNASGIYFCRVRSAQSDDTRAMLLIK